jgi:hypothetical protein
MLLVPVEAQAISNALEGRFAKIEFFPRADI